MFIYMVKSFTNSFKSAIVSRPLLTCSLSFLKSNNIITFRTFCSFEFSPHLEHFIHHHVQPSLNCPNSSTLSHYCTSVHFVSFEDEDVDILLTLSLSSTEFRSLKVHTVSSEMSRILRWGFPTFVIRHFLQQQ